MRDPKGWLQSTTIWGLIVAIAPLLSAKAGIDLPALLGDILQLAGVIGVIYGRFTAKTPLSIAPIVKR